MEAQQKKHASQEEYEALLLAASKTAGSETWKTRAGRKTGPDTFIMSDAWQCMKISLQKHVKKKYHPELCPICMENPTCGWYCTKSCNHWVCKECLRLYSKSLLEDPSHVGPLKCPCCPRLLREEDALVALALAQTNESASAKTKKKIFTTKREMKKIDRDDEGIATAVDLLEKWQNKALNELLRKMEDYRPCPNCQKLNNTEDTTRSNSADESALRNFGGGFVTGECLGPINDERESSAQVLVSLAETGTVKIVLFVFSSYYLYCCTSAAQGSELRQLFMAILPVVGLPIFPHLLNLTLVRMARKQIMRPITVTCPCCEMKFNLASSEIDIVKESSGIDESEMATQLWKNVHTRNCPVCSTPIEKNGGCNHVRCGKCRSDFCWACMRARTSCRAYNCSNGAPYGGNASAGLGGQLENFTLMERIDLLESRAREQLRLFPRPGLCIPILCWLSFIGLDSWIGKAIWWFLYLGFRLWSVFCVAALCWATSNHCRNWLRRHHEVADGRTFRTEAEMVAEAVARSMREY